MRHEMQSRRIRKLARQLERILDRAHGQRAMLERKQLPAIRLIELRIARAGAAFP